MPAITPCLWFDGNLEDAMDFYCSVFPNSKVGDVSHYGEEGPGEPGTVMAADWTLDGQRFRGINGGPEFQFTAAISFDIACTDQADVDYYWEALTADDGQEVACGWVTDKFGVSWQVVPTRLDELMSDADPKRAAAATAAMLRMKKIVIADLEAAASAVG